LASPLEILTLPGNDYEFWPASAVDKLTRSSSGKRGPFGARGQGTNTCDLARQPDRIGQSAKIVN